MTGFKKMQLIKETQQLMIIKHIDGLKKDKQTIITIAPLTRNYQ